MNRFQKIMFAFALLAGIFCSGCGRQATPITKSGFYFDTVIQITIYDDTQESLLDECMSMAEHYEKLLSRTLEGSDIYRLNHADGQPVTVSDETLELLGIGLNYCQLTDGAFDITMGAVSDLWDIKNNPQSLPSEDALAEAMSGVGYENILIDGNQVALPNPATQVDLGGIAKGFIADKMKSYLNENGIHEGTINLGGNVLTLGPKSDKTPYRIGIQKPFDATGEVIHIVTVTDGTVVTSGIYERYFELDGKIYHHILDSNTGYPCENGLLSVTILCPDSVDGDALSTSCFVLGQEKAMELLKQIPDAEAIFITEDYEVIFQNAGNP